MNSSYFVPGYDPQASKTLLVTGGCGFVGSNFINHVLQQTNYRVINLDKMSYCSNKKNLTHRYDLDTQRLEISSYPPQRYLFVKGDINDHNLVTHLFATYQVNIVVHFAAQTHVDLSFGNSLDFVRDNVLGTATMLECARLYGKLDKFIHVSTDEVYGEIPDEHTKNIVIKYGLCNPTNPYAATKVGAEMMAKSYLRSYRVPVIITRCNNIFGPYQYWDKVIPKFLYLLAHGRPCPIHGQGTSRRHYLHVSDVCRAFMTIIDKGTPGNIYEMNSTQELTVLEVAKLLISQVYPQDKENWQRWITFVPDRLFHDCRYIVNPKTMNDLGWHPSDPQRAHQQIMETAQWYLQYAIPKKHWDTFQVPEDAKSDNNS